MYWLRHVHDRARAALSILKISEIEEILVPFVAKFAQAMIKPYYLEREIFVKRCNRICFGVRQVWAEIFDFEGDAVGPPMISLLLLYYILVINQRLVTLSSTEALSCYFELVLLKYVR